MKKRSASDRLGESENAIRPRILLAADDDSLQALVNFLLQAGFEPLTCAASTDAPPELSGIDVVLLQGEASRRLHEWADAVRRSSGSVLAVLIVKAGNRDGLAAARDAGRFEVILEESFADDLPLLLGKAGTRLERSQSSKGGPP